MLFLKILKAMLTFLFNFSNNDLDEYSSNWKDLKLIFLIDACEINESLDVNLLL